MLRSFLFFIFFTISLATLAQTTQTNSSVPRPKLVVGIVVDQMRWDFFYRYYDRYSANGFKKLLNQGFSCENAFIPYAPTVTAPGHATVYTGSVPAIHGITGNGWWDKQLMRTVYCTEDTAVKSVGILESSNGAMSPRNMLATSITDELRLATNFRSKVVGVAFKDRGSILPAGHTANAAYWYDGSSGKFITSDYYMKELPAWVNTFNEIKWPDILYKENWNTLFPIATYVNSTSDQQVYESKPLGRDKPAFPYDLSGFIGKNYGAIANTPHGNTMTLEMAKAAIKGEKLGADAVTDFLAVSFSAPDYIGHSFGPNSIEIEDTYLRLDRTIGELLTFLDLNVGKGQYLLFLTADHGVSQVPGFLTANKLPGGIIDDRPWVTKLNANFKEMYGVEGLIVSTYNYQVHLNHRRIDSAKLDAKKIKEHIIRYYEQQKGVAQVYDIDRIMEIPVNEKVRSRFANGYFPRRNGDIQLILEPHWMEGSATGTTHGSWYPYDAHIPMLFYGWQVKTGKLNREVYMTDIAPTIAAMLKIQTPSGSVGDVITEAIRN